MTARKSLRIALIGFATMFTGCAHTGSLRNYVDNGYKVGPEYCKPAAPIADTWIDEYDQRVRAELPNYADWWASFNDPILDGLMEQTYQQNLSVKSAGLRVLQARYLRAIAIGGLFPQQQEASGSFTQVGISENIVNSPPNHWYGTGALGLSAAWEVDFWGKFRRNIESADASLDASVEDYDNVLLSLLSETAATYIDLRTAQQQLQYAQDNVKIQEQSLNYAEVRFKSGAVTELDVTQAQTVLSNTQQSIPLYESQVRSANNRLCVLLGIPTRDLTPELGAGPIPTPPADIVVGVPANLLRRRPDVRAAERQVAAQSAAIGVAAADLLPHFSIVGSIALESENFSDLFKSSSVGGGISPGFNWDILNYGRLVNNVNLQNASFQQLAVDYQQTVLQANSEVENGINQFLKSLDRLRYANQAVTASQKSVDLALAQYRSGATDFNRVYNLQGALVQAQNTLASVQSDAAQAMVATYKALGGGWEIRYGIRRGPLAMIEEFSKDDSYPTTTDEGNSDLEVTLEQDEPAETDEDAGKSDGKDSADDDEDRMLPPVPTDDELELLKG
ncbi:efflux transporter outer membrane subunit [Novipirellula aureliae]|nr:efflux transporter outer membrane subunit [Novipirellula aureliae]